MNNKVRLNVQGHRWRSDKTQQWLQSHGLYSVSREEIGGIGSNSDRGRASDNILASDQTIANVPWAKSRSRFGSSVDLSLG